MAKDGNDKVLEMDMRPGGGGELLMTVKIDRKTGGINWTFSEDGVPSMLLRDYLLKICDRLFMDEVRAYGDNNYMRRIGGLKKKGIIQ